jgi:hypothetical protein
VAIPRISINPTSIAAVLAVIASILVVAHLGGQFSKLELGHGSLKGLIPLFNLSAEQNIPAYFSVMLMLFAALLLAAIAAVNRQQHMAHTWKWIVLSGGFVLMAFDEAFSAHERLMVPMRALLGVDDPVGTVKGETVLGIFYFAWVIPGMVLVALLGLYFIKFLLHLPAATRNRFLVAAVVYLSGTIGFELIGGRYAEVHGYDNWTYTLIATAEETLEMAGVILFIRALLKYCAESYEGVLMGFALKRHESTVSPARQPATASRVTARPV